MEEIEKKFLDIDPMVIKKKLAKLGAKKKFEILYRKMFFDHPDFRYKTSDQWLRLRDEGDKITLAYKKLDPGKSMEEVEIIVDDFNVTEQLLYKLGFVQTIYSENKRERYVLNGVEIDIDTYPLIPPYLEIEAPTHKRLDETARLLGLDSDGGIITAVTHEYVKHGIDLTEYKIMTFDRQEKI